MHTGDCFVSVAMTVGTRNDRGFCNDLGLATTGGRRVADVKVTASALLGLPSLVRRRDHPVMPVPAEAGAGMAVGVRQS